jgi:hypothetical protein
MAKWFFIAGALLLVIGAALISGPGVRSAALPT